MYSMILTFEKKLSLLLLRLQCFRWLSMPTLAARPAWESASLLPDQGVASGFILNLAFSMTQWVLLDEVAAGAFVTSNSCSSLGYIEISMWATIVGSHG